MSLRGEIGHDQLTMNQCFRDHQKTKLKLNTIRGMVMVEFNCVGALDSKRMYMLILEDAGMGIKDIEGQQSNQAQGFF